LYAIKTTEKKQVTKAYNVSVYFGNHWSQCHPIIRTIDNDITITLCVVGEILK